MAGVVIFDMDGTLVDTMRVTLPAIRRAEQALRLAPASERAVREAIGWANPEYYFKVYPDLPPGRVEQLGRLVEREERALMPQLGSRLLFKGVDALLTGLHAAGFTLCLASTGSPEHVSASLAAVGIAGAFEQVGCGQPDKTGMVGEMVACYQGAVRALVGDTLKDVSAARSNKIPALGAGFGYVRTADRAQFDRVYDAPGDLLRALVGGQ